MKKSQRRNSEHSTITKVSSNARLNNYPRSYNNITNNNPIEPIDASFFDTPQLKSSHSYPNTQSTEKIGNINNRPKRIRCYRKSPTYNDHSDRKLLNQLEDHNRTSVYKSAKQTQSICLTRFFKIVSEGNIIHDESDDTLSTKSGLSNSPTTSPEKSPVFNEEKFATSISNIGPSSKLISMPSFLESY